MSERTLAVIAARGGSKGYPGKNLATLAGKPLLEHAARAAWGSKGVDRVIVSTEDETIADLAVSCGIEVPFRRPRELARDSTALLPVLLHALDQFEKNEGATYDVIVSLDPTAPFKLPEDIDRCLEALRSGATSAQTVCEAESNPYVYMLVEDDQHWVKPLFDEYFTMPRRQDAPVVYRENGLVQSALVSEARQGNWPVTDRCKVVVVPQLRSVMIDKEIDMLLAQMLAPKLLEGRGS